MKKVFLLTVFASLSLICLSQQKIPIDSASKDIGVIATVCSKVYGVKALANLTFINMGASYPNSPVTVVIFTKDLVNFKDSPDKLYNGKEICVTGKIDEYKGKTQIVVTKAAEIEVE